MIAKNWGVVTEIFSIAGTVVFDRFFSVYSTLAANCRLQLAFRYRQNNIDYTPLSSNSAMHQQQEHIIAGLQPSGQNTLAPIAVHYAGFTCLYPGA